MNNKETFVRPLFTNIPYAPATDGVKNVKQLANNVGADSNGKKKKKKRGTNKAQIPNAKPVVKYATIGCQTDRTIDNYGSPRKTINPPAQANCGPSKKGRSGEVSLKHKSNQTDKAQCKNASNQTKRTDEPLKAQPSQLQTKQNAEQPEKQKQQLATDEQRKAQMKPNESKKQQPQKSSAKLDKKMCSVVDIDGGQTGCEASVRVNMSIGPRVKESPVKKYTQEELLVQMVRLDMNNNQPPELAKMQSGGNRILSNISQLELRAELLVNSVPFRMPNST